MEDLLEGLNEAQREAVTATEGFVRVIAGAGSGKTRALSHRFAFLVNELGILPGNILCVTFTNKSAAEMRQRIHRLTGDDDTGYINTFHGFCVSVLQEDSHVVGYPKSFLVLDNADIDAMLQMIYEERGLSLRDMTFRAARDMIEIRKLFKEPEYYRDMLSLSLDALKQRQKVSQTMPTLTGQQANILYTMPLQTVERLEQVLRSTLALQENIRSEMDSLATKKSLEPLATADLLARWLNQTKDLHQGMCQNLEKVQRGIQEENRQAGKQRDEFMRQLSTVIERLRRDGEELQKSFRRWAATTIMCSVAGATAASILVWRILG